MIRRAIQNTGPQKIGPSGCRRPIQGIGGGTDGSYFENIENGARTAETHAIPVTSATSGPANATTCETNTSAPTTAALRSS